MRLAQRLSQIGESVTLQITSKAKKLKAEGVDVVSFAAGEPDFDTPKHIKDAAVGAIAAGHTKYTPAAGLMDLRQMIVDKLKKDNGIEYTPAQVVVSNGAKQSLYNILQAICQKGDEVLIPAPYWLSYPAMVHMAEAVPVYVKTSEKAGFIPDPAAIEAAITPRTRCIIVNSPSNPTGCVYERATLEAIAAIAVKHDLLVISDEIYEKLIYDGKRHVSIASLGGGIYDRAITVNGVSKSYSMTGWRIGYAAGPLPVMKAIGGLQSHATSNPCSISQHAARAALSQDQSCIDAMRAEYLTRRDYMVSRVSSMPGISCVKPAGAFYLFCNISALGMGSLELATKLLDETRVAVIPGQPFGADDHIRLSFATDMDTIRAGLDRIEKWTASHG